MRLAPSPPCSRCCSRSLLGGCAPARRKRRRSKGATMGGPFTLTDQNGRRVSDRDFAGKYRLVYFGYTFCPDVCPVDLQMIGAGLRRFEAERSGPRRAGPADLHHRRSGARHAGGAAPLCRRLPPAPDRPHRQRGRDRRRRARLSHLSTSAARRRRRRLSDVNHTRIAVLYGPDGEPIAIIPHDQGPEARRRRARAVGAMRDALLGIADRERSTARNGRPCATAAANAACTSSRTRATGALHATNVACRLLDRTSCRCTNYKLRARFVPDCVRLDAQKLREIDWLPSTCAYRLRAEGKPLGRWHYLVSGEPRDGARGGHVGARLDDIGR